jgi:hypothetical protein
MINPWSFTRSAWRKGRNFMKLTLKSLKYYECRISANNPSDMRRNSEGSAICRKDKRMICLSRTGSMKLGRGIWKKKAKAEFFGDFILLLIISNRFNHIDRPSFQNYPFPLLFYNTLRIGREPQVSVSPFSGLNKPLQAWHRLM